MKLTELQQETIIKMFNESSDLHRNNGVWVTQNTPIKKENNRLVPEWCVKTRTVESLLGFNLVDYKGNGLNIVALTQKGMDEVKDLVKQRMSD